MPALPWTSRATPHPDATYVVMGTYLPLRGYRFIPRFLADTMKVRRQLARADGLVGYALDAHLLRKEFFTVSVWESREAVERFAPGRAPHSGRPHHAQAHGSLGVPHLDGVGSRRARGVGRRPRSPGELIDHLDVRDLAQRAGAHQELAAPAAPAEHDALPPSPRRPPTRAGRAAGRTAVTPPIACR